MVLLQTVLEVWPWSKVGYSDNGMKGWGWG